MARILGFQYGEMRGKLGGNVFSRNKAGAYVRAKVTPVNPQTVRQQTARYRFGNMSILYQTLSSVVKDCWQSFASTHFNPLKGNNTGIYTGGNAFVALRQSAAQGNDYRVNVSGLSGADAYTISQVPYNEILAPPTAPSSATIRDNTSTARLFNVEQIQIDVTGNFSYQIVFPGISPTGSESYTAFENEEGQTFGIGIYISNNLKFEGSKPNTALKINFANTGVIEEIDKTTGGGAAPMNVPLVISGTNPIDQANTRDFPCAGDWVLATPFIRTKDGAQKLMAPMYVEVIEALA